MTRTMKNMMRTLCGVAGLGLALSSVGCSSTMQAEQMIEAEPVVLMDTMDTLDTLVIADDTFVAQRYSLVAADSIGLAAFGQQIVLDDLRAHEARFAEVR